MQQVHIEPINSNALTCRVVSKLNSVCIVSRLDISRLMNALLTSASGAAQDGGLYLTLTSANRDRTTGGFTAIGLAIL